jgi:hypothetical protein
MPFNSFLAAVKHTYLREGVVGFYRGFGVALVGVPLRISPFLSFSIFSRRNHACWHSVCSPALHTPRASAIASPAASCSYFTSYDMCKNAGSALTHAPPFLVHMGR